MNVAQFRGVFQQFFEDRGHRRMRSASLIPQDDPTVLFTSAGMQTLSPFFLGKAHPLGRRLVAVQKCLRMDDIDNVGDERRLTFFEMLGNWSLGDYFRTETINWNYEFLTGVLHIPPQRVGVTLFAGDENAPRDDESAEIWRQLGVHGERVRFRSRAHNWWGPVGILPACGPDSKVFLDSQRTDHPGCGPGCPCGRWIEIWDNIFLEYRKTPEGRVEKAPERNVDTGMGLERTVMVLNGCADVYELDTLAPIVARIQALSTRTYAEAPKPFRVIADHIRAATFAISDGTRPANVGAGHVVRRLIRRAVRYGRELAIADNFCSLIAEAVIASFGPAYPELPENRTVIMDVLLDEEQKFRRTLEKGLRECTKAVAAIRTKGESVMSAKEAFHLYESSGFPLQLTAEVAREGGIEIDEAGFQALLEEHRNVSRHRLEHKFRRLAD